MGYLINIGKVFKTVSGTWKALCKAGFFVFLILF